MLKRLSEQFSSVMHRGAQFLQSKYMRRTLTAFSIVSILVGIFVIAAPTHAEGFLEDVANGIINGVSYIMIAIAGIFIQVTIFALKFFIEIAGYNNFIDADIVQLGWNMVRDVANMFFVVVLLVIAFGTILGLEQYEWKKTLIKLVMAAFFVNFSNLICQLIIDVAQVFTITFLNAVAGAAGGNLIKMFNFDEILNISSRNTDPTGIQIEFFAGAVMTVTFAGIAMATMGAYLFVIIARMVVLWTLMILSPLAFLFSALPNTQSYAQEFWNEFIHHVIVAPVMVFFLWLAFATFGGGNIVQTNIEANHPMIIDGGINRVTDATDAAGNVLGVSISAAASWENMANFAVAIAFLWIGIERVQKLGVVGGGIVSGAMAFGKNVATIGSGLALGRWLGSGAKGLASQGTKAAFGGLYAATLANPVERTGNWLKRNTVEGWRNFRSRGPMPEMEAKKVGAEGGINQANVNNQTGEGYDNAGNKVKKDENGKWIQVEDDGSWKYERGDDGEIRYDFKRDKQGKVQFEKEDNRGLIQKAFYNRHEALLRSRKLLEKVQKQTGVREELMDKRVTANPKHIFQGLEGHTPDALDRMEQGMLEAEKMRSAAKTEEFQAMGKQMVLDSARFKDGKFQTDKPTLAGQIAAHKENAKLSESLVQRTQERARRDYLKDSKGQKVVQGRIQAELEVKQAQSSNNLLEGKAKLGFVKEAMQALKEHKTGADENDPIMLRLAHMETEDHEMSTLVSERENEIKSRTATHMSKEALEQYEKFLEDKKDFSEMENLTVALGAMDNAQLSAPENAEAVARFDELTAKFTNKEGALEKPHFSNLTFDTSIAQAESAWAKDVMGRATKTLHDFTEDEQIYKTRGMTMPSTAMQEFMEKIKKNTRELEYHQTLAGVEGNALQMLAQRKADPQHGVTMEDAMVSFALLDHGMDQSWIDDMAQRIWDNPELKKEIAGRLGWTDSGVDGKKAGQIQHLVATGWDVEWVANQQKMNDEMDSARAEGVNVLKETSSIGKRALGAGWEEHYKKMKKYNEPMQKLGSYKDRAIANGHLENGGHTQYSQELGMYIPVSEDMAYEIAYSDYGKQNKTKRSDVHSHTVGRYNNRYGILTNIREAHYKKAHGANLNSNDMKAVKDRNLNNYMLYSAGEKIVTDSDGYVEIGGAAHDEFVAREIMKAPENLFEKGNEDALKKFKESPEFKLAKKRHAAQFVAAQLRGGAQNFVMTAITDNETLKKDLDLNARSGKIQVKLAGQKHENVSGLIDEVNVTLKEEITEHVTNTSGLRGDALTKKIQEEFEKVKVGPLKSFADRFKENIKSGDLNAIGIKNGMTVDAIKAQVDRYFRNAIPGNADIREKIKGLIGQDSNDETNLGPDHLASLAEAIQKMTS